MMYLFRCDPCELVSTVYGLLQCIRSSELERIVKRGTLLDNIMIDLGQPLPPQFDHGDFNFWIFKINDLPFNWYTVYQIQFFFISLSLADSVNLNVIICHNNKIWLLFRRNILHRRNYSLIVFWGNLFDSLIRFELHSCFLSVLFQDKNFQTVWQVQPLSYDGLLRSYFVTIQTDLYIMVFAYYE